MTEAKEIKWAIDILGYKVDPASVSAEVWKQSELVKRAISARGEGNWHDDVLESIEGMAHEIASTTDIGKVTRYSTKLSDYWRWKLWIDCMADTPLMVELLFQGLIGAAFDASRNSTKENK